MENAQQCVENLSSLPKGKIKLCTSVGAGQSLLAKPLALFNQQYPEISLDLTLTNRRVDIVEEGFDLAVRIGESPGSSLISKKLITIKLVLVASLDYLAKHDVLSTPEQMEYHQCLYMNSLDNKHVWPLFSENKSRLIEISPQICADDFNMLKTMVINHCGIGLFPEYLCTEELKQGIITRVLPEWCGRTIDIYAIYPSRKGATPKIRALLDFLAEEIS